jgi:hypothetical protein
VSKEIFDRNEGQMLYFHTRYICTKDIGNFGYKEPAIKVKVKLSLGLTKHHAMKTYWGVEV